MNGILIRLPLYLAEYVWRYNHRNNDIETHLPAAGREKTHYKTIRRATHLVAVLGLYPNK